MNQVPPSATMTASEPSVRKDCRCFLCQKVRPEVAVGYQDPFCSTACCRSHYGVRDPWLTKSGRV